MAAQFPWDKLKAETLKSISRDLGLPPTTKDMMVSALLIATAQSDAENPSRPDVEMSGVRVDQQDALLKREPFDFSTLCFTVKLVTSEDGCYSDRENPGLRDYFGDEYDSDGEMDSEDEDQTDEDPWLKIYYVKIETKDGTRVGQFGYRVIDKSARRISVWMSGGGGPPRYYNLAERLNFSERGGSYLEGFGHALWNNNLKENPKDGNLKEELVTGDRRGTGVFQTELNKGSLAVMSDDIQYAKDDLFIREEFRGQGIGTWALRQLFKHDTLRGVRFIFAEPWATRVPQRETDRAVAKAANEGVQLFFKKAGFRRVGQSEYFAYALADKNHPSHRLAIEDDADYKDSSTPITLLEAMLRS